MKIKLSIQSGQFPDHYVLVKQDTYVVKDWTIRERWRRELWQHRPGTHANMTCTDEYIMYLNKEQSSEYQDTGTRVIAYDAKALSRCFVIRLVDACLPVRSGRFAPFTLFLALFGRPAFWYLAVVLPLPRESPRKSSQKHPITLENPQRQVS